MEEESYPDRQKLEFIPTKPTLKEMLKELLKWNKGHN